MTPSTGAAYPLTDIDVSCYAESMRTGTYERELPVRHKSEPCCTPVAEPSLSLARTASMAEVLKVLGDATRLRMLDLLAQQEEEVMCVCDRTARFEQNQPTTCACCEKQA